MGRSKRNIKKTEISTRRAAWKFLLKHDYNVATPNDLDVETLKLVYLNEFIPNDFPGLLDFYLEVDNVLGVETLIGMGVNPNDENHLLDWVIDNSHFHLVEKLLENPNINADNVFYYVCTTGQLDMIKSLLADPRVDPTFSDNAAFDFAQDGSHYKVARLLLGDERVHNTVNYNRIMEQELDVLCEPYDSKYAQGDQEMRDFIKFVYERGFKNKK